MVDNIFVEIFFDDKLIVDKLFVDILLLFEYKLVIFLKKKLFPDKFSLEKFDIYTKFELLPI
jgi:hypothetical protein